MDKQDWSQIVDRSPTPRSGSAWRTFVISSPRALSMDDILGYQTHKGFDVRGYSGPFVLTFATDKEIEGNVIYRWQCYSNCD